MNISSTILIQHISMVRFCRVVRYIRIYAPPCRLCICISSCCNIEAFYISYHPMVYETPCYLCRISFEMSSVYIIAMITNETIFFIELIVNLKDFHRHCVSLNVTQPFLCFHSTIIVAIHSPENLFFDVFGIESIIMYIIWKARTYSAILSIFNWHTIVCGIIAHIFQLLSEI